MRTLSEEQAYLAMFAFLDQHFQQTGASAIGALLGSMSLLPDGHPADSAMAVDWNSAVNAALAGTVDARMHLSAPTPPSAA